MHLLTVLIVLLVLTALTVLVLVLVGWTDFIEVELAFVLVVWGVARIVM